MAQPAAAMDKPPYTNADFREDAQKQLVSAAGAMLSASYASWPQIAPFLEVARAVCRDDLRHAGRLAVHGLEQKGAELAPADEAYVSISARDRSDDAEWLSETYWLSDLALADRDPERVRAAVAAIERTLTKLRNWLDDQEVKTGGTDTAPPASS